MKYIIIEEHGIEVPIIFSELSNHRNILGDRKAISAGFCRFSVGESGDGSPELLVNCWGKSVTLGIASRKEIDQEIILRQNEFSD